MSMKKLLVGLTTVLSAGFIQAATMQYTVQPDQANYTGSYPNLDLFSLNQIKVTATTNDNDPFEPAAVTRVELVFDNATNLVATNFKQDQFDMTQRSIVNNAWIYRSLLVEVSADPEMLEGSPFQVNLAVVESNNYLNNLTTMTPPWFIFDAQGLLTDVSTVKIADVARTNLDGKAVTLKLEQKPSSLGGQPVFNIQSSWLGHGDKDLELFSGAGGPVSGLTAIALIISEVSGPMGVEVEVAVEYEDAFGMRSISMPENLRYLLEQMPPVY